MKKILSFIITIPIMSTLAFAQGAWTQKADLPGPARYGATAFTIAEKGYVGMGYNGTNRFSDMWEYNPDSNTWTQKAGLPVGRFLSASFAIGTKGYVCLGLTGYSFPVTQDVWEYDASQNTWTKKNDFPGLPRYGSAGFSLQRKGYICCGNEGLSSGPYNNELWEYDSESDSWTRKADFPGDPREGMSFSCFELGDKEYVGLGGSADPNGSYGYYTFYAYDPASDTWSQIADYPGRATGYATGFVSCGKGFMGTGDYFGSTTSDYWQYDPALNQWTEATRFPAARRCMMAACSINGKGYVGTGFDFAWYYNDWWEYSCSTTTVLEENSEDEEPWVYPNPSGGKLAVHSPQSAGWTNYNLAVHDANGKLLYNSRITREQNTIDLNLPKGVYYLEITSGEEKKQQKIIID